MAWTTPRTWANEELVDEDDLNTHVRDQLNAVHMTLVGTLPESPFDGQLIHFTNNAVSPLYCWQLRYNDYSASSYKWEFIGGSDFCSEEADVSFANVTSYAMTNSPAAITAPLAGEYDLIISGTSQRQTGNIGYWSYNVNSAGAADGIASTSSGTDDGALWFVQRVTLAAADSCRIAYRASSTGTNHYLDNARLRLRPFRVG